MVSRRTTNADLAAALREMALFLEVDGVPFKPQAYERAAYVVMAQDRQLADIYATGGINALTDLPGVGKGIAERIIDMLENGQMGDLESLRKKTPVDIVALTALEGVGPKKARALWRGLEVRTVADLERAAKQRSVRALPGFGPKSEQRILDAIALRKRASGRRPLGEAREIAGRIGTALEQVPGVVEATVAGSIRRCRESIGDVDILVASDAPERLSEAFVDLPEVQLVHARGPTKTLVRLANGMDADLRVISPESFGAALLYFTGSKAHNVALRRIAQKKGLKLNEYGLFRGERRLSSSAEKAVYAALGLDWIPAELREDHGEIELAKRHELPVLIKDGDIRGDLHVHTNWTDGTASIEDMARAAKALGREYIVITDHTRDLAMVGGLDEKKLRAQIGAIREVNRKVRGVRVLAGAEVNIRDDGSLDIDDAVLVELDVVGVAVHSRFDQSRSVMTRRIIRAVDNPHVDVLFHPTSRALGRRRAIRFDFEAVLAACARTGTVLEVDSQPERLDLPDTLVRVAVDAGAWIAIDSDAHSVTELGLIEDFGLGVARRGWAPKDRVINALAAEDMLRRLKGRGPARRGRRRTPRAA